MPGHLLRRCQQIAVAILLQECRAYDLTPLQFAMLSALADYGALDQARLGGLTALDRTTVGVVGRGLERRGLVVRRRSDRDRRARQISITAAGKTLLAEALPAVRRAQARLLAPLQADEQVLFVKLLSRIAESNNQLSRAPLRLPD